jgi:hypothetical protein
MGIGFTRGGGFGGLLFPRETKFMDAEAVVFLTGGSASGTARALRRAETIGSRTGGRFVGCVSIAAARPHTSGHELLNGERVGMVADIAPEAIRICHTASRSAAVRVIPDPHAPPTRTDFHAAMPGAFDITDIAGILAEAKPTNHAHGLPAHHRPKQTRIREAGGA